MPGTVYDTKQRVILSLAVAFLALFVFNVAAAFADDAVIAPAAPVVVPVGSWVSSLLESGRDIIISAVILLVGIAAHRLPGQAATLVQTMLTEQVVARAVDWGFAVTSGAVKGKTMTLPQANAVVAAAEEYAIANAPVWATAVGDLLRPKIIARMGASGSLPAEAHADALAVNLPAPAPAA